MTLSQPAQKVLAILSRQLAGHVSELARATGFDVSAVITAALELEGERLVTLSGPPNQNATSGYDIDRLEITTLGYMSSGL